MSEIKSTDEIVKNTFFFIRFGERQHLESLQKGKLFMHNSSWHNDLEERGNVKGQGDKYDGKLVFTATHIEIHDPDTDALLAEGSGALTTLYTTRYPIFCMSLLNDENIMSTEIDEVNKKVVVKFAYSEAHKEYIKSHYKNADSAMIILDARSFINQVGKYAADNNIPMLARPVKYADFSINQLERMKECGDGLENAFFWKDDYFRLEQEFRFIFDIEVDDNIIFDIGKIEKTMIIDIDEFYTHGIMLSIPYVDAEDLQ